MIRQKGLTFIEVIIALLIIGILSTLSMVFFTDLIRRYRIQTIATHLTYALQYARSEAIKRNANVYVSFSPGDTWCYGMNVNSACNCNLANNCSLGTTSYSAAGQATLSLTGLTGNSLFFETTHGAANTSGSITITTYNEASPLITVSVGRLGNIQMCSTGISGYNAC